MKTLYGIIAIAMVVIASGVWPRNSLEPPPPDQSLVVAEIKPGPYRPRPSAVPAAIAEQSLQSLPAELSEDAETIQVYIERKRELLSQQLGLARAYEDDLHEIKTAAQAQAELDRWSQENAAWRTWQAEAAAGLIENEAELKRAIGEQKFALLQGWEAKRHAEEPK